MENEQKQRAPLGEVLTRDFLILATVNLCMFFGFQMLNTGLPVYLDQLGATTQAIGLATTVMTIAATATRVFSGALLDRFGRTGLLVAGIVVMGCSIVSFAIFPIVGVVVGLRALQGIGWGMGSTASSTIAADIIPKHRFAEGMGYFAMTTAVSSAIAPAFSLFIVDGFGSVYMIYAATGTAILALAFSVISAAVGKRKEAGSAAEPSDAPRQPTPGQAPQRSRLEALFDKRAVLPGLLMLLVNFGFGCTTTFIVLHANAQGVEGVSAYFVVYAIVTLVSRPYTGRLIDRYGYRIPAILSSLCAAGTLVMVGLMSSFWMLVAGGVLAGLGIGTAMGTFQAMAVASVEPWRRGVATSTYMTLFDLGIAAGSLLGGVVAAHAGYTMMFLVTALFPLAASALSFALVKE